MDLRCKQTVGRRRDGRGNRGRRTRRGTGATPLEERVRRLEKDVEELRGQVRTHAQAQTQVRAIAETQYGARVETPTETPETGDRSLGCSPPDCRPRRGGWRELASSCSSWGCPSSCGWASSKDGSRQPCAWREAWALAALSLPSGCLPEPPVPPTRNCSWAAVSWRSTFPPSARGACGNSCPTRRHLPSACSPPRLHSRRRCV